VLVLYGCCIQLVRQFLWNCGTGTDGDRYAVLSDILGDEDHLGDMDFKVLERL
jgi:hypothetical protein